MSTRTKRANEFAAETHDESSFELTRRRLLRVGAGSAVLLGVGGSALAQSSARATAAIVPAAGPHTVLYVSDLLALVNRATQGFSESLWQEAQVLGFQGFLDQQLDPGSIPDTICDSILTSYPTLRMTNKQLYDTYAVNNQASVVVAELRAAMIVRAAYSKRQLFERMVEFWTDHFNIDQTKNDDRWLKTTDDRDVIRSHALDTFPALLNASAHSAAMLYYLDNYTNKKSAPNENYARELMELHTIGVGNFTETDVKEVARCLTGWTYKGKTDPNYGQFLFNAGTHDTGAKTVLGNSIPAGGNESDGLTVLSILANHPATAQFLARKMCRWLLSYSPPQSIVDQVAATYTATGGDIKSMIRDILAAGTFAQVPAMDFPKLRRPFQLVTSLLRATAVDVVQPAKIVTELSKLGQTPYSWPAPNGYPESLDAWGNGLMPRWTFIANFFDKKIAGVTPDAPGLLAGVQKSDIAARIDEILTGSALDPADVQAVQRYVNHAPTLTDALRREAFALAASSPSYQYY